MIYHVHIRVAHEAHEHIWVKIFKPLPHTGLPAEVQIVQFNAFWVRSWQVITPLISLNLLLINSYHNNLPAWILHSCWDRFTLFFMFVCTQVYQLSLAFKLYGKITIFKAFTVEIHQSHTPFCFNAQCLKGLVTLFPLLITKLCSENAFTAYSWSLLV